MKSKITLDGTSLTIEQVVDVALKRADVEISASCLVDVQKSADIIKAKGDNGKVIYGVTTGFGSNADKVIKSDEEIEIIDLDGVRKTVKKVEQLQKNLLRSHACGVGDEFPEKI